MATVGPSGFDADSPEGRLGIWAEQTIGGRMTWIEKVPRWRPAWNFDLDLGDRILPLHARGWRGTEIGMPWGIAEERRTHDLLEANGIPVPHAFGYSNDPYTLVMDRLPGFVDLSFAKNDGERAQINLEYLEILTRIHQVDLDDARSAGFTIPETPQEIGLGLFRLFEAEYEKRMLDADPVSEFLRLWMRRHYPQHRTTKRFLIFDAFQFMFDEGKITGLIDFELSHIGDPLSELATLQVRNSIKSLGDLPAIVSLWSDITGEQIDYDVLDFHNVGYNVHAVLSAAPLIRRPSNQSDLMSHYGWYVNGARWAFETIASMTGVELTPLDPPASRPTRNASDFDHLVRRLSNRGPDLSVGSHEQAIAFRVARHLQRLNAVGDELQKDDLEDAFAYLGRRLEPDQLDEELTRAVHSAGPEDEAALLRLFDRRIQRLHQTLGPEGSMILRHPRLRSIRPGGDQDSAPFAADDLPWTPGLIAGTK